MLPLTMVARNLKHRPLTWPSPNRIECQYALVTNSTLDSFVGFANSIVGGRGKFGA